MELVSPNLPADPNIYPGDEFCLNIRATNFITIDLVQFGLGFDPSIIEFLDEPDNPCVGQNLGGDFLFNGSRVDQGVINIIWTNPLGDASSLDDGDIFFKICFEALASPGECTSLLNLDGSVFNPPFFTTVQSAPSPTEFCVMDSIAFDLNQTEICIGCEMPTVSDLNICNSTGSFCFSSCGMSYPIYSEIELELSLIHI